MKPSKALIAGAAVAGLLSGSLAVRAYAASTSNHPGVSLQTMADAQKPLPKHACKGQNDCKGQGGGRILVKTRAKEREAAQPTEASRSSNQNPSRPYRRVPRAIP